MSKRTVFTTITPLPAGITREIAVAFLQDHLRMIDLNPLVIARHPISCPANAPPDEHHCSWYSLTDSISYLPGGKVTGQVSYTAAFNNVSRGVQTHVYAPMGLNIRETWTVGGTLPGEPSEPVELGLGAPQTGLYVREDVDMRCNVLMASFVKKTLKKAHSSLVEAVKVEAQRTADTIAAAAASPSAAHPRGAANPSPGHSWSGSAPPACSGNPPPYEPVSSASPAFSFTASPATSRRLSMDDKDLGLLIDHNLYTLSPLQAGVARLNSQATAPAATNSAADPASITFYKLGREESGDDYSSSPILSRLTTNLPPYLAATSFASSPTLERSVSPTSSGPHSAFPSPLRPTRRPTSASCYPTTPHEEAVRPSPSARFSAWQPLKPSISVVSKYPRAKEQDYSDIAAANPFDDSDDSSSWDSPILGHANTGHFPSVEIEITQASSPPYTTAKATTRGKPPAPAPKAYAAYEPTKHLPAPVAKAYAAFKPGTESTAASTNRYSAFEPEVKSSGSSYLRRYPAQEPEIDLLGGLSALGILPTTRPRSAMDLPKAKAYSPYVPPSSTGSSPAPPALSIIIPPSQNPQRLPFETVGATLRGPSSTNWYY